MKLLCQSNFRAALSIQICCSPAFRQQRIGRAKGGCWERLHPSQSKEAKRRQIPSATQNCALHTKAWPHTCCSGSVASQARRWFERMHTRTHACTHALFYQCARGLASGSSPLVLASTSSYKQCCSPLRTQPVELLLCS